MRIEIAKEALLAATLNNVHPAATLPLNEFHTLQNMRPLGGMLVKRGGCVAVGSAPASGLQQGLFIAYRDDGTETPVIYCAVGGTIYYTTSTTWTTTGITGWNTSAPISAATFQGYIYFCNGINTPARSQLSSPGTTSSWGTLPTSFNPSGVIAYGTRFYAWGDTSTPKRIHMSDFLDPTTWQEQNFYQFPDDQAGGSIVAVSPIPKGLLLYGHDVMGTLTGYSELDHEIQPWPRAGALLSRRAIADVGGGSVSVTTDGAELRDGFSPPRPLDAGKKINFAIANLTNQDYLWAVRCGPSTVRIFFRNRGDTTLADSATVSVGTLIAANRAWIRSRLSTVLAASAPTVNSHYYELDLSTGAWSGPHTGAYSCAAWESSGHGHRQNLWVGDAVNGKIYKADQDTYKDNGVTYTAIVRTGGLGLNPFKTYVVKHVEVMTNTAAAVGKGIQCRVIFDEQPEKAKAEKNGSTDHIGGYYGNQSTLDLSAVDRGGYCVVPFTFDNQPMGRCPQIELIEDSDVPFVIRGIAIVIEEVP